MPDEATWAKAGCRVGVGRGGAATMSEEIMARSAPWIMRGAARSTGHAQRVNRKEYRRPARWAGLL